MIHGYCADCGSPEIKWALARGWVKLRTEGGPNQLSDVVYEGSYLCNACRVTRGLPDIDQLELPL